MSNNPLVSVRDATCRINRKSVLRVADFSIRLEEHWCLYGPNGAGKSLLASLICGQRVESNSYVSYGANFDPLRDCLIVSFEEQQKLWQRDNRLDMSEYDQRAEDRGTVVSDLISASRSTVDQDAKEMASIVERLALNGLLQKGIRFLSSGQIRKVLIARALYGATAGKPKLIVLDDPLESIDKQAREDITQIILEFQQSSELGKSFASLLLSRRKQDVLPGTTHMALLDKLTLSALGSLTKITQSPEYGSLHDRKVAVPKSIPGADRENKAVMPYEELIRLENVNAQYGELSVLNGLSWVMTEADHVLIEGPNGCGKSTLLSLIDGDNHKAYGQDVFLFGRRKGSGESIWEVKANFGIVSNELHNKYTKGWKVLDVVVSGFFDSVGLYDDSGASEIEVARDWLTALGIDQLGKSYYHELSFGQQRLVLLARAMVKQPRVLVLDEPCVGLDDYHRQLILGTLDKIAEQTATRLIYVSHVADEQPACINQCLSFVRQDSGSFIVEQSAI